MANNRFAVAVLSALVLLACMPGEAAPAAPAPGPASRYASNCSTVVELLEAYNFTSLIAVLNETNLIKNFTSSFRGTLLAPNSAWGPPHICKPSSIPLPDAAFDTALALLSPSGSPSDTDAISDTVLEAVRAILNAHILPTAYPTLEGKQYATLDSGTRLQLDNTTLAVKPRSTTDSAQGSVFGNVLPTATLMSLEGEPACNGAYVYGLEGFLIISPSIIPQLLSAAG